MHMTLPDDVSEPGLVYARRRTGYFWQGRYGAVAMDEDHLAAATRSVNLDPVRGREVKCDAHITLLHVILGRSGLAETPYRFGL
jgi:hypothetical protein